MKRTLLTIIAALLLGGVVNAQGWGETDSHAKSSNTPIVASVTLDGNAVTPTADYRLGAFVGEELRGLAAPHDNNFWIQVFYDQGTTEEITFKLWDPSGEGTELTDYTLTYGDLTALTTSEEGYGTPSTPVVLSFTTVQTMTQTSTLAAGWTWWSTPIELDGVNSLTVLENNLGIYGSYIKSSSAYTRKKSNGTWGGSLQSQGIDNAIGYKIQTTGACEVSMTGTIANPAEHPITLHTNWNWIGYPVNATQTPANALPSDFTPEVNDQIKGQGGYARYKANGTWAPSSFVLEPGKSYLYKSLASEDKTFTFVLSRGAEEQTPQKEEFYWNGNISACPDNNSVLAIVLIDGEEQRTEYLELGAFINGECRGNCRLEYDDYYDRYFAMFTVTGNDGDDIHFGIYTPSNGEVNAKCETNLVFVSDDIVGDFEKPFEINFNTNVIGDGNMALFPNPVERNQPFSVLIPSDEEISDVMVFNALGTEIRHESGSLKTSSIAGFSSSGVYMIKIVCRSGNIYYNKLIVR